MDKTIVTELVFDVPGTEMIEALSKKAEECRSKADAFGQILEEALVAEVTAESVQKACKLSGEEFRKEYLPEAPQFVANLQRHRSTTPNRRCLGAGRHPTSSRTRSIASASPTRTRCRSSISPLVSTENSATTRER